MKTTLSPLAFQRASGSHGHSRVFPDARGVAEHFATKPFDAITGNTYTGTGPLQGRAHLTPGFRPTLSLRTYVGPFAEAVAKSGAPELRIVHDNLTRPAAPQNHHALNQHLRDAGGFIAAGVLMEARELPDMDFVSSLGQVSRALRLSVTDRLSVGITWMRDWAEQGTMADQWLRWAYPGDHLMYANGSIPPAFRSRAIDALLEMGAFERALGERADTSGFQLGTRLFMEIADSAGFRFSTPDKLRLIRLAANTGVLQRRLQPAFSHGMIDYQDVAHQLASTAFTGAKTHIAARAITQIAPYLFTTRDAG